MKLKIGILGTGRIAEKMAHTISLLEEAEVVAVAARDLVRARDFATQYNISKAYGSYSDLLADLEVELVYIATVHSVHYEQMMSCLQAGKHILCEKAFTCTVAEAEAVFAEANKRKLLVTEAVWTRFMPLVKELRQLRFSKPVGEIWGLTANLAYPVYETKERVRLPELGGGALLDVGIYPLTFASIVLGDDIKEIQSSAIYSDTGVDVQNSITLHYEAEQMAVLNSSVLSHSDRRGVLYCTGGYIEVENINNFESIAIFDNNHKQLEFIQRPEQLTGYEYEVQAVARAVQNGWLECPEMPQSETVRMMHLLDDTNVRGGGVLYSEEIQLDINIISLFYWLFCLCAAFLL